MNIEAGWRRLRGIWRPTVREDVEDEVAFHMEMRVAEYMAAGLSRADATERARAAFGDVRAVSERLAKIDTRRRRRLDLRETFDSILLDLRLGARFLRTHAVFTLTAILTLTLGIGASTAIFSVVNAVILRPLPYDHPEQLVAITQELHNQDVTDGALSLLDIRDLQSQASRFESVAGFQTFANYPYSIDGASPESITFAIATDNIFDALHAPIAYGRGFRPSDGAPNPLIGARDPNGAPPVFTRPKVTIISYGLWQRRFHGDSSVLGRTIVGPTGPRVIIGVASPKMELLFPARMKLQRVPDAWDVVQATPAPPARFAYSLHVIGRLARGVSVDDAQAQVDSIGNELDRRYPQRANIVARLHVTSMQELLVGDVKPALVALMGAVIFVLLIACANVGSLLLVRASHRSRELTVRAAIGGSPWRIMRQLLAESVLLGGASAVLGVLFAIAVLRALLRFAPRTLPKIDNVGIDTTVLVFAMGIAIVSVLMFGLGPAMRAARPSLVDALRGGGRSTSHGTPRRLLHGVVVAEVALSFVLLIGCGLMVRTFVTLLHVDLGFQPKGLLSFTISNRNFFRPEDRIAYVHQVRDTLANVPGVEAVSIAENLPFDDRAGYTRWGLSVSDAHASERLANVCAVIPGFFEAMGAELIAGRTFTDADDRPDQRVVIVDDVIARRAYGTTDVVGRQIVVRDSLQTIVGVVRHARQTALAGTEHAVIYHPWSTGNQQGGGWIVRTNGDLSVVAGNVRAAIATIPINYQSNIRATTAGSTRLIVNDLQPMSRYVDRALAPTRFALLLIGVFAVIAAILTAVGLYGVLSSAVRQRTSEIGVRMAFGANPRDIFSLMIGHGMRLSAIGLALGVAIALAATRILTSMLVGVQPTDPVTFIAMTLLCSMVALLACWVPARRAASLDPNVALREDAA